VREVAKPDVHVTCSLDAVGMGDGRLKSNVNCRAASGEHRAHGCKGDAGDEPARGSGVAVRRRKWARSVTGQPFSFLRPRPARHERPASRELPNHAVWAGSTVDSRGIQGARPWAPGALQHHRSRSRPRERLLLAAGSSSAAVPSSSIGSNPSDSSTASLCDEFLDRHRRTPL
jgi:hypothetical protein